MTVIATDKPAHHELGASSRSRWANCPGSVAACRGRPNRDSAASKEGTLAHLIGEIRLLHHFGLPFPKDTPTVEPKITPDMDAKVQEYVDYCIGLAEGADMVAVEHRTNLDPAGIPGGFGTADFVVVKGREIHIADLKYGQGVRVHAPENPQLELYGLGTYFDYDWAGGLETIVVHVVQPRLGHFDRWEFPVVQVPERVAAVQAQAAAALAPDAPRVPGEKACQWCLAKADCPALAAQVLAEVVAQFKSLEDELSKPSDPKPADKLSDEDIAKAYAKLPLLKSWSSAINAKAFDLAAQKKLPGYKIVAGQSRRAWDNPEALEDDLKKAGYTVDDYAETKVLSPAALEKRLGKKHELIAAHVVKKPGNPTLAPEWDKRAEVDVTEDVTSMFEDESGSAED